MAPSRILLTGVVVLPLTVLGCTSSSPSSDGAGGAVSGGGGSPASGGSLGAGGNGTGGASSGGASAGGTSSGAASSDGGDGFGGELGAGGADGSGGAVGVGGTGGSAAEPYAQCDQDLGDESNPDCTAGEVCFHDTCMQTCPTDLNDAALYDCPELTTGTPPSQCAFVFGRCELVCEGQGSLPDYECPSGMDCLNARCVWP